ncbi:hypothetical protein [Aquicoccus porphyridii]|uniref:hypothetical protein n=1 Tax=Aquicoccus porphyridii TaxID=1852029 RepID=UPI00165D3DA4|nr:hypothetical protein [Aquicoccus porphyridii]
MDERHWFPILFGVLLAGVRCAVLAGTSHHAVHHGMCAEAQRQRGQKPKIAREPAERSACHKKGAERDKNRGTTGQTPSFTPVPVDNRFREFQFIVFTVSLNSPNDRCLFRAKVKDTFGYKKHGLIRLQGRREPVVNA